MYWLKACPRCGGDLHEEQDHYGVYVACIQCGYVLTPEEEQRLQATERFEWERAGLNRKTA